MKTYYWIGSSEDNHMKGLKVIEGFAEEKDMQECIYFESRSNADKFLEEMQKFIKDNYWRAHEENWYTK